MVKQLGLLALLLLAALPAHAQGGKVTLIQALPEPLPNCTPSTGANQRQGQVWDTTSQSMKTCTATNTWSAFGSGGGTFYQTVEANASAVTQQPILNLIAGVNMTVTCVDNGGATRSDCTFTSSATGATAWSAITAAANSNAGTFAMSGNTLDLTAATFLAHTSAGYAPTTSGTVGYDTTANKFVFGVNGATVSFALPGSPCVSQVITAISATAVPTCSTPTTTVNGVTCNLYGSCTIAATGGANVTLSNLTSPVALNQDLLCATNGSCSLGKASVGFNNGWFAGNVSVGGQVNAAGGFFIPGATVFNVAGPGGTCSSGSTYPLGVCVGDSTGGVMLWDSLSGTPRTILSTTSNLVSGNLPVASSNRAEADSGVAAAGGKLTLLPGPFSGLPTCNAGAEGGFAEVNDSTVNTFGASITVGGGGNKVLAHCNGANWTVAGI